MTEHTPPVAQQASDPVTPTIAEPQSSVPVVKAAAEPSAKPAAIPATKSAKKTAPKPLAKAPEKSAPKVAKVTPAATTSPAASAAESAAGKAGKSVKAKKAKLVRDSFTMPEAEYNLIAALKKRCLEKGIAVKKSEVLRAAIVVFAAQSDEVVNAALKALEVIKTGRPPKGHK